MTGIIVITYNQPEFVLYQHDTLKKFCRDNYQLIIVDNSTDPKAIEDIAYYCKQLKLGYLKTNATSANSSDSHAFAANAAYNHFKGRFDNYFFVDHDLFSIKPFSVTEILGDNMMAGLPQVRGEITYYWPGCTMFKSGIDVDFSVMPNLDTGGGTYKAIEAHKDRCIFFDETYQQNQEFNKSQYNFYALIHNGTFMHFLNGSNWNNSEHNQERINSLLNIVKSKIV